MSRYRLGIGVGVVIHCLILAACVICAPVWVPVAWGLYWVAIWAGIFQVEVSRVAFGWAVAVGVTGSPCGCKRLQIVAGIVSVCWRFGRCRNDGPESAEVAK